ncbi:MAG: PilZ domain-containing protein [Myxococcota bacterium]
MPDKPLPGEDQLVTMVSVREGNIYVTSARVLVSKATAIGLHVDTSLSEPPSFDRAQPLTLLYTRGDRVLRLKAVVREPIDSERLTVQPVGDVKEGDRRDFRRADVRANVYVAAAEGDDLEAAREAQMGSSVSDDQFREQEINLSGSGAQIVADAPYDAGSLLDLRIILPLPTPTRVAVIAEVVRSEGEDAGARIATRFAEISETDQDLVVYTVFSRYFEAEGLTEDLDLDV